MKNFIEYLINKYEHENVTENEIVNDIDRYLDEETSEVRQNKYYRTIMNFIVNRIIYKLYKLKK